MKSILSIALAVILFACQPATENKPLSPRLNHMMLYVSDLEASIAFYTRAFDLKVTNRISRMNVTQPDGTKNSVDVNMAFLKFPGQDFVFEMAQQTKQDSTDLMGFRHVGIDVMDIESALLRAIDSGAELVSPVRQVEAEGVSAKNAFVKGPDGELIEFMQILSGEF